jgi:hypothetical protein
MIQPATHAQFAEVILLSFDFGQASEVGEVMVDEMMQEWMRLR